MPSFRRRAAVVDADRVDDPPSAPPRTKDVEVAQALAEAAEAEAAEAKAVAAAARARARAVELSRLAEAEPATAPDADTEVQAEAADAAEVDAHEADAAEVDAAAEADAAAEGDDAVDNSAPDEASATATRTRLRRLPRPSWKRLAVAVVVLCTLALVAASGYMVWHHRQAEQRQQLNAEYAAAGRQGVVNLMSLNFTTVEEDVQRIIDNSTGKFKEDFEAQAADFVTIAKDAKVVTDVTVNASAVDTMTDNTITDGSAVVLVAATSRVTNSSGAQDEPRSFRLSVSLQREGDQIKMSRVEFVP